MKRTPREKLHKSPEPGKPTLSEKKENFRTLLFLFPSFLGVLVFFVLPFCIVIWQSLTDGTPKAAFVGLENYIRLFQNAAFLKALRNTGVFSVIAVPSVVILSLFAALLLERKIPGKSLFRTFFLSPMVVPVASVILIWQVLFDAKGVVNDVLAVFGNDPVDWLRSEYGIFVVVLLFLWKNIGYNMVLFLSALSAVPKEVAEVAMLDGCGPLGVFFRVRLRYLTPAITFVTLLSFINSFKIFREVYLLAGDYPYDSIYTLQHFMNNTFGFQDYQKLSGAAVVLALIVAFFIFLLLRADGRAARGIEDE